MSTDTDIAAAVDPLPADRPTILIVDDEQDILVALEDLFEGLYEVVATASPREALAIVAARDDIAVILSDERMPEMAGHDMLGRARLLTDAEAILLTGYADLSSVIAAINDGRVSGYVHKPWEPEGLLAMVAGAVERHRLKRALAIERAVFEGLIANAADGIALLDGDGRIVRANAAGRAGAEQREAAERALDARVLDGDPGRVDLVETADECGEERVVRVQRVPIARAGGQRLLLRIETDISAERAMERRLRQAEKLQALGTLAGGIAHDFNNLLTAVIGNLDLAQRRADSPHVPRYVAGALEAARRGAALTQRLLAFSRNRDTAAVAVDVDAVVRGMGELLERTLGGLFTVTLELGAGAHAARAEPDQLELVILNLCVNARDAMPDGGTITIRTEQVTVAEGEQPELAAGAYLRIAVTDMGTGIDPATLPRVFEPFFTTKELGKGTGLGLSMAYGMASGLGGTVAIESAVGEGTTVALFLPATDAAPTHREAEIQPHDAPAALRLLLVEDDPAVRAVARGYLDTLGHQAIAAEDGAAACAVLDGDAPLDALISDFAMPGLSGLEVIAHARDARPGLPVLLVTGFAESGQIPADVHRLAKPFTADELAAALASLVADQSSSSSS